MWDVTRTRIRQAKDATMDAAERVAAQTQDWMRDSYEWTDRTGAAGDALTAEVRVQGRRSASPRARIDLFYDENVLAEQNPEEYERVGDYGRFLETMQAGRFAIVQPAGIRLRQALGRQLNRVWRGV